MSPITKIIELLTPRELKKGAYILFLVTIMALLETLGIASIMPFLAVLGDPSLIQNNWIIIKLSMFSSYLFVNTEDQFLLFLGLCSFFMIILTSAYKVFTFYKMYQYLEMLRHSIASRSMETYLSQPYSFFLGKDSSDIAKTILSEVDMLVATVIRPGYIMLANIFVFFAITILLFLANPLLLICTMGLLTILYFGLYYNLRVKIKSLGDQRLQANKLRFAVLNEALNNIKFVKFYRLESTYVLKFKNPSSDYSASVAIYATLNQVPKYLIEAIAFGGLIALIIILLLSSGGLEGGTLGSILPTIGLYVFAVYRLQPAVQAIFAGFSGLKYGENAISSILDDLNSAPKQRTISLKEELSFKSDISLNSVTLSYNQNSQKVLKNLSLKMNAGTKIGIVGKTGSGKTTLIDVILGLLEPNSGYLEIDHKVLDSSNIAAWQNKIGYVPQDIILNDTTIAENIAFGVPKSQINYDQVVKCAKLAQLHEFVSNQTVNGYKTFVGERGVRLSGGQRQRLGIARALYHDPDILVFDEATSALDSETEKSVMESINSLELNKTIILIAHRVTTLQGCDRIIQLEAGNVVYDGKLEDLDFK